MAPKDTTHYFHQKDRQILAVEKQKSPYYKKSQLGVEDRLEHKPREIQDAEYTIFRAIQERAFPAEREALREAGVDKPDCRQQIKTRGSKLLAHNPFMDKDGLIRVGSCLVNATIKEETKFPIILPRNDASTTSLVRATHVNLIHAGPKLLLAELRQRVWILQGL